MDIVKRIALAGLCTVATLCLAGLAVPAAEATRAQCEARPPISMEPTNATVQPGEEARFSVTEGSVPLYCAPATIQWQVSVNHGLNWTAVAGANFAGATTATLSISRAAVSESGNEFRAVLTNARGGTASLAATLTVNLRPVNGEARCGLFFANFEVNPGGRLVSSAEKQPNTCNPSITSGVTIESANGSICTAGPMAVPIEDVTRTYLLTAGHCLTGGGAAGPAPKTWEQGAGGAGTPPEEVEIENPACNGGVKKVGAKEYVLGESWFAYTPEFERVEIGHAGTFVETAKDDYGEICIEAPQWMTGVPDDPVFPMLAEWGRGSARYLVQGREVPKKGGLTWVEGQTTGESSAFVNESPVPGTHFVRVEGGLAGQEVRTIQGDSGGPWFQAVNANEALMEGITSHGFVPAPKPGEPEFYESLGSALEALHVRLLTTENEVRVVGPAFGRCVGYEGGAYTSSKCSKLATGKKAGKYRWELGPGAKKRFTIAGAKSVLQGKAGAQASCESVSGSGEYSPTDAKRVIHVRLLFKGCKSAAGACASQGKAAEEVEWNPLEGEVDWEAQAKRKTALLLEVEGGEEGPFEGSLVTMECGGLSVDVEATPVPQLEGARPEGRGVLVPIKYQKPTVTESLKFKAAKGIQKPTRWEGVPETNYLLSSVANGPFERTGLSVTLSVTNEEAMEVGP